MLFLVGALLGVQMTAPGDALAENAYPSPEKLVRLFARSVSWAPAWPRSNALEERRTVHKWNTGIGIGVELNPTDKVERNLRADRERETFLTEGLERISRVIGVKVHHLPSAEYPKAHVGFWQAPYPRIPMYLEKAGYPVDRISQSPRSVICGFDFATVEDDVSPEMVFLNRRLQPDVLNHCIVSHMLAVLGLPGLSTSPQRSLHTITGTRMQGLNEDHLILLRTLYDARIKNRMDVSKAIQVARQIIPELIVSYRTGGEQALRQP